MTTQTSRVREVVNAYQTLLQSRSGLAGVTVFRYAPSPRDYQALTEFIVLANRIPVVPTYPLLTVRIVSADMTLEGEIVVILSGAGDDTADAAQARAEALYAEIEDLLTTNKSLGLTSVLATVGDYRHVYGGTDQQRAHKLEFQTAVTARQTS